MCAAGCYALSIYLTPACPSKHGKLCLVWHLRLVPTELTDIQALHTRVWCCIRQAYSLTHTRAVAQDLVQHWATKFDWRKQEAHLNRFPQFKLPVNGIDLHFVHLRSADPDAVPLVLSHGWPGSFFGARRLLLNRMWCFGLRLCSTAPLP